MVDKIYCMSYYLAFRYIPDDQKDFFYNIKHRPCYKINDNDKLVVNTSKNIDDALKKTFNSLKNEKLGLLLSGGMDSAILASYLMGGVAYTFRFLNGNYQTEELKRAEAYAKYYNIDLRYVDISWDVINSVLTDVMSSKGAPVHSIEPQLYVAAQKAKLDGVTCLIIGNGSDYVFGGMDKLLSKDWKYEEFKNRYMYLNPQIVLNEFVSVDDFFKPYMVGEEDIDFVSIIKGPAIDESYSSYENAFSAAGIKYVDPYSKLKMNQDWDLQRIRNGESKYLIRELFSTKYPNLPVPEKLPMPRPVDFYFKDWSGPTRSEFRKDIPIKQLSGNQKWQLYCLEKFLEVYDS